MDNTVNTEKPQDASTQPLDPPAPEPEKIRKIYRVNNGVSEEIKWEEAKPGFIIRITNQDGTPIKTKSGAEMYRVTKEVDLDGVISVEDLDKIKEEVKPQ